MSIDINSMINEAFPKQYGTLSSIVKLAGDASSRQYFRVSADNKKYIVCADKIVNDRFVSLQKVFSSSGALVPKIIGINHEKGLILQQDLGDRTLLYSLSKNHSIDQEFHLYKDLLDQLFKIHSIDKSTLPKDCENLSFDFTKLNEEVQMTHQYFLSQYLKSSLENGTFNKINLHFSRICKTLSKEKFVFVHRDFHSKNIMCKDDQLFIIDFQDARFGLPQYDLVSLLDDCYYSLEDENVDKLKKYYWDSFLSKLGIQDSFENFSYLYDLMLIQRTYKAIGSFAYIFYKKNNPNYLKHIGFAFEKLRKTLRKYPEYNDLSQLLSERFYEN